MITQECQNVYEMYTELVIHFLMAGNDHSVACEPHAAYGCGW